ncbi:MAG: type IV pilus assembly protein PilM [Proteobacteria bacterium]|nr:type IV pilus assembly protein PilM [Pseudomonadota bacterium]MBU1386415.1 type IV pilus assembly protein PilM [Pseudomonadota bacterium]MBU1544526.1 type IV pilus assembly protein PilM [Pseudomonadota bacterium]MBU2429821.1 type IV pilus assembly protein PilM [Pseudomonadota bacterium]MBU2481020.1 type IV pilus assembly protein PilM [Pseudomonadota bacterium]
MIFGKKDHLVGLDIGSSFIKLAELKDTGKGLSLHKFGMARIKPGLIVEGRVVDMETLADKIKALFKSQKIREKNVAISTGGHSVVIKTINMAKRSEKELHDAIHSEAEQYIPYDIDDVNIDYQILGESEFSPEQINVLLVAVKKDLVAEYIELIHMAGLNPRIIDVDTFALQNTYEILPYESHEKVTLLVDIGASKTSLNILKAKASLMMRDTVSGTNQFLEEVANSFDISMEEAEQAINGETGDLANHEKIQEIGLKIAQLWCSEICEVVNTYQSSSNDEVVEKIILCGGGVFLDGLKDCLLSELEADVSVINPFEALIVNENKFPDSFITKAGPLASIAIGLALRRVDDK